MKIDSANLLFNSKHQSYVREESKESLRMWSGNQRPDFEGRGNANRPRLSLSNEARALAAVPPAPTFQATDDSTPASAIDAAIEAADKDPFLRMIRSMIEMLTGETIRSFSAEDMPESGVSAPAAQSAGRAAARSATQSLPAGFGAEYNYHAVREEFEQTDFSAQGVIRTADGKEISFKLDLSMRRSYREETNISLRVGNAMPKPAPVPARKDPLVLNFDGATTQLSNQRFRFDLNSDGNKEELAMLAGGSGYLAIDLNQNGKIDNGRELFGPATDSGFGELAALDSDDNGWIDENDAAYDKLRVWTPDVTGAGTLETLRKRQVGAIAVAHVASPFELRGSGNSDLGAITASGIFLSEDGHVGSIQEIDLSI